MRQIRTRERRNSPMNSRLRKALRFYKRVLEEAVARFFKEDALTRSAALLRECFLEMEDV